MKLVSESLYEFERAGANPDVIKDTLGIGDFHARSLAYLKAYAEKNGWGYEVNKNGNVNISAVYEIDGKEFSKPFVITFPKERADTEDPISLRNSSGQLMDRFPNARRAAKRISDNIAREQKSKTRLVTKE